MRKTTKCLAPIAVILLAACHPAKTPQATAQDIAAARQEATREVADARAEASKDVKSAARTMGPASQGVADAKTTGSYDVAMAKADGARKIAAEKCLTLQADMQQACKAQAEADYDSAAAIAKATRLARRQ